MYSRDVLNNIKTWLEKPEVIILFGARQVGKSTLIELLSEEVNNMIILNCENPIVSDALQSMDISRITSLFDNHKIVAFDEAQEIPKIGKILKLLFDDKSINQKFIATGSSSFELANKTGEPLTGRNIKFRLFPLSINEISKKNGWLNVLESVNSLLIYGSYPGIIDLSTNDKRRKLLSISGDYLFKDIYKFEQIRNPEILRKLLKALALQLGNLVSLPELAQLTGVTVITVERYLDLLEKSFVIFKIGSFSSNLRNELKKSRKYYFYDNGIRNAVLNNFIPVEERTDIGALWENFCVSEHLKKIENSEKFSNLYFWRTYDGAEIDLIEERDGEIFAYEYKWNPKRKTTLPKSFASKYPVAKFKIISRDDIHFFKD